MRARPAALFTLLLVLLAPPARAETDAPEAVFQRGAEALNRGEYGAAIDAFESLADRGFLSPDASYDRGLAYVQRVRAKAEKLGDLGRAAAAFEEALLLRPDDRDADAALDLVRAELARRRSRRAKDAVDARPTLDRVIVGLASEETWGLFAFLASLLFALGLVLRRRRAAAPAPIATAAPASLGLPSGAPAEHHHDPLHVAGSVLAPIALVALAVFAPLAWGARELRLHTRPAVVVVPEAFLSDEVGQRLQIDPIPEAAKVEASERRGGLVRVRWGAVEGWTDATSVRLIGP